MVKNLFANTKDIRDTVWSQHQEDPLEEGMETHSSILAWKIPMDRGDWWATVHRVAKSRTWLTLLSTHTLYYHFYFPSFFPFPNLHNFKSNCMLNSSAFNGNATFYFEFLCLKVLAYRQKFWQTLCSNWSTASLPLAWVWLTITGNALESPPGGLLGTLDISL